MPIMGCASVKPAPPPMQSSSTSTIVTVSAGVSFDPPSLDFARLMKDPDARAILLQHAQSEHSEENLLFYEGAQRFRGSFLRYGDDELSESDRRQMRERASNIVDQFLREESEYALNLPSNQISVYKSGLKMDMEVKPNMFDAVSRTIYRAIEHDTFSRFKGTRAAEELLKRFPGLARRSSDRSSRQQRSSKNVSDVTESPAVAAAAEPAALSSTKLAA